LSVSESWERAKMSSSEVMRSMTWIAVLPEEFVSIMCFLYHNAKCVAGFWGRHGSFLNQGS